MPHISHADQIVKICREEFGMGDKFVQKITGNASVDRPLQKIREFRNLSEPKVVVTVDMLSTGVDIPALEFIVFMRPVKSRILWVQMLGRGTRLCPDIYKSHFTIFDCFDGTLIKYFKNTTDFEVELPSKNPLTLVEIINNIFQNVDRVYYTRVLVKRLRRIQREMSGEAIIKFAEFIPDGDLGKFAGSLENNIRNNFVETIKILRNNKFQKLLLDYPRAKKTFLVAYENEDVVTSEELERFGDYEKAEDYLEAFSKFVKTNKNKIDSLSIIIDKPKKYRLEVIEDLRNILIKNKFIEKDLRKAHSKIYHKAMVDIISMIKHAAIETEPVLDITERVNNALEKVFKDRKLNIEQKLWIEYIREHLIKTLSLDLEDFRLQPVFEKHGGLRKAELVFKEDLDKIISSINSSLAA
jgi:type I restriction enzyme R subunit